MPFILGSLRGYQILISSYKTSMLSRLTAICKTLLPFAFFEYKSAPFSISLRMTGMLLWQADIKKAFTPFLSLLSRSKPQLHSIRFTNSRSPCAHAISRGHAPSRVTSKLRKAAVAPPSLTNASLSEFSTASMIRACFSSSSISPRKDGPSSDCLVSFTPLACFPSDLSYFVLLCVPPLYIHSLFKINKL